MYFNSSTSQGNRIYIPSNKSTALEIDDNSSSALLSFQTSTSNHNVISNATFQAANGIRTGLSSASITDSMKVVSGGANPDTLKIWMNANATPFKLVQ
jgi:hypothetical protein